MDSNTAQAISLVWTGLWLFGPYPAFLWGMFVAGRWIMRMTSAEGMARDSFYTRARDVCRIDRGLVQMRRKR